MEKKYDMFLTIILIVSIIAIVVLVGFWLYDMYSKNRVEQDALDAIEEFNRQIGIEDGQGENNVIEANLTPIEPAQEPEEPQQEPDTNTSEGKSSGKTNYDKYKNFTILGNIEIPKTKVNYPVLAEISPSALNVAVAQLYGPGPNQLGNTIIIGHNNRNGLFFSNNKKLNNGDTIYITDLEGNRIPYTIYNIYKTTDTDTDYMTRDTHGAREISLSTCTDDGKLRLIIWAKAE